MFTSLNIGDELFEKAWSLSGLTGRSATQVLVDSPSGSATSGAWPRRGIRAHRRVPPRHLLPRPGLCAAARFPGYEPFEKSWPDPRGGSRPPRIDVSRGHDTGP